MILSGEIDMASAPGVRRMLEPHIQAGGPLTIDLSDVTFMDSTAIHVLIEAATAQGDRGCVIVHGAHGAVQAVFEMTQVAWARTNLHVIDQTGADDYPVQQQGSSRL